MTRALKRILVGVDDSPAARSAVDEAVTLAAQEGAGLVFVHVFPILGEDFTFESKKATHVPDSSSTPSLKDAEEHAQLGGVQCTLELLVGDPPKELALRADELDVDLIVVGSRRMTGIKRALLGSTSRSLLSESNRPILVVPYVGVEETASV
jgi:nucleotide-binding universal stress UspA family protein